jgi:hypothetical protein
MKINFTGLLTATILASCIPLRAVDITAGAAVNSGFGIENGTDLPTGSLVRLGVFTISDSLISSNSGSYSYLNANFIELGVSYIGEGNPTGAASEMDAANAGLFNKAIYSINTTNSGLNVAGLTLSYWVFDAVSSTEATQHGIFSSTLTSWILPSGDGGGLDLSVINTDISDLTTSGQGVALAGSAKVLVGGFGPGMNTSGGGVNFTLTAVPEPATYAALFGLAAIGFCVWRKRRVA